MTLTIDKQTDSFLAWYEQHQADQYEAEMNGFDDPDYCMSFLETADADGNVPDWAYFQIMDEHNGGCITDYTDAMPKYLHRNGEAILTWLGY